ncbi:kinase-like domain-containing protein [Boletus edulis BED1]|uniref:Kinase-like domain-containing protein n=1 Tax=Boletus edulis BED1 TaxID=1328754 RepID=A0AAD4BRL8_BOLED|nr:kinase-like domain-containing protein [Boletus edulis BED1]
MSAFTTYSKMQHHQLQRRPPFTNASNQAPPPPPAPEKQKAAPPDPPLPRQNSKTTPPSPPKVITDKNRILEFHRVGFLGEGGFARVYEVKDVRGTRHACKVVTKTSLKTKKAKTKLYAEIKIHRSLAHPNIVRFYECFEDDDNVYMTLELCHNGSLMDMLRRRRRFTEPEARFFLVQIIGACNYMHTHQVIHRDLKLGNLFLDSNMNIKVGDFGLAALIENPGERKKTICGTPNYIAPKCCLTQQTDTVLKSTPERRISPDARECITSTLTPDPNQRPTLLEIIASPFIDYGIVPPFIPISAHDAPPDFRYITRPMSIVNLAKIKKAVLLNDDQATNPVTSSIAQQEKEFQKAVQPGSPISALLSSARQPLVMSTTNSTKESSLFRKLQSAKETKSSPLRTEAPRGMREKNFDLQRQKELESQKARIVAQMVPVTGHGAKRAEEEQENVPPLRKEPKGKERARDERKDPTLTLAFDTKAMGKVFRDPREDACLPDERVFIVSWVDYCNKYGMGYALTDGSVGVHFNDTTTLILAADKHRFDYISSRRHGQVYVRKNYSVSEFPDDLKNKVYLLKHFERYIMDRLYGDYEYTYEDLDRTKGMDFVQKYLRMKHVIVFKMSHDVLQFNFYDHSKVILSSHGLMVTHIDKNYKLTRYTLSEVMAQALQGPAGMDAEQAKFLQRLVDKLKYCKEVLTSIRNASAGMEEGKKGSTVSSYGSKGSSQ